MLKKYIIPISIFLLLSTVIAEEIKIEGKSKQEFQFIEIDNQIINKDWTSNIVFYFLISSLIFTGIDFFYFKMKYGVLYKWKQLI